MLHYRFVKIDRTFNYNELAEFGSQTSLSANKGVNQQVMRFTPFITPKFLILKKTALLKIGIFACIEIKNPHHFISNFVINNSHDIVCF